MRTIGSVGIVGHVREGRGDRLRLGIGGKDHKHP